MRKLRHRELRVQAHAVEGLEVQTLAECDPKTCAPNPSLYCLTSPDLSWEQQYTLPCPGTEDRADPGY